MGIENQPMNVYWSGQKSESSNKYKINHQGTVASTSDLPSNGNQKGDTYNVSEDGSNYIWTGSEWDKLGSNVYVGATSSNDGVQGLVPPASSSERNWLLRGDGTWVEITSLTANDINSIFA